MVEQQKNKKKKYNGLRTILLITILLLQTLFIIPSSVSAVTIQNDVYFIVDNENYSIQTTHEFSIIQINETNNITFNTTKFTISSGIPIKIKINYINTSTNTGSLNDNILIFQANTTIGTVFFNISGFKPSTYYNITRNSTLITGLNSSTTGYLNFSNDVWSNHTFTITLGHWPSSGTPPATPIPVDGITPYIAYILFAFIVIMCLMVAKLVFDHHDVNGKKIRLEENTD